MLKDNIVKSFVAAAMIVIIAYSTSWAFLWIMAGMAFIDGFMDMMSLSSIMFCLIFVLMVFGCIAHDKSIK